LSSYTGIIANSRTLPNHITTGAVMEIVAQVMSTAASAAVTGKYSEALLRAELKKAKQEADAIMRLYGE